MENKKAGEEVSSSPDLDQEYEVHTSAPQEEMEFFLGNKFFSATKYMNMRLSEVVKDPRFISNGSLKNMLLSETKCACEQLCGNAEIRRVTKIK